jgi:hypothetical protein
MRGVQYEQMVIAPQGRDNPKHFSGFKVQGTRTRGVMRGVQYEQMVIAPRGRDTPKHFFGFKVQHLVIKG